MMKKLGDFKMTDHKIYEGKYTNIYTGFNPTGKNVVIKEVLQSQFVDQPLQTSSPLV